MAPPGSVRTTIGAPCSMRWRKMAGRRLGQLLAVAEVAQLPDGGNIGARDAGAGRTLERRQVQRPAEAQNSRAAARVVVQREQRGMSRDRRRQGGAGVGVREDGRAQGEDGGEEAGKSGVVHGGHVRREMPRRAGKQRRCHAAAAASGGRRRVLGGGRNIPGD
jgi:hypothetical protein